MSDGKNETNELLRELLTEIRELKEATEKKGDPLSSASASAPSVQTEVSKPSPKKSLASSLLTKSTMLAAARGADKIVDFIAPQIKQDINEEFNSTHTTPYERTKSFVLEAARQGMPVDRMMMQEVYDHHQRVGRRELEALRDIRRSSIHRGNFFEEFFEKNTGFKLKNLNYDISEAAQAWWNNDSSRANQRTRRHEENMEAVENRLRMAEEKNNDVNRAIMRNDRTHEE